MSAALKELYKQTLLKHSKQPHNEGPIADARAQTLRNPLCGDEVTVYLKPSDNVIEQIGFTGQCCAICTASASMMTLNLKGISLPDALARSHGFLSQMKDGSNHPTLDGDLSALAGVREFPSRIRCATLPWEALSKIALQEAP